MAEEAERIGARMKERREELGLTQREVAEQIPGSAEAKDVSRWEHGRHRPHADTLTHIAKALETDVTDLLSGPLSSRKPKTPTPSVVDDLGVALAGLDAKLDALREDIKRLADDAAQPENNGAVPTKQIPPVEPEKP